jgi:arylformamidase
MVAGMRTLVRICGCLLGVALLASCGPAASQDTAEQGDAAASPSDTTDDCEPGTTVAASSRQDVAYADVDGVDPNLLSLDVDVPAHDECEPPPIVVWVHGGGWNQGDKASPDVAAKRELFLDQGWAFAAVNYRLSPSPIDLDDPEALRYPTHPADVAAALGWLDGNAEELGVDADRIGLLGHSAGAGIVSLLATDESFLVDAGMEPEQLAGTVSLDTEAYDVALIAGLEGGAGALYRNAFGEDPAVWAEASPEQHVDGDEAPFLVVTRGNPARTQIGTAFVAQLQEAGADATRFDAEPYSHAEVSERLGEDDVLTSEVVRFYERVLGE